MPSSLVLLHIYSPDFLALPFLHHSTFSFKAVGRGTEAKTGMAMAVPVFASCILRMFNLNTILSFVYLYLLIERKRVSKTHLGLVLTARKVT